jgi:hypothetical protein
MISVSLEWEALARQHPQYLRLQPLMEVPTKTGLEVQWGFELCDELVVSQSLPTLGLFAGIHGIEAIGVKILHRFVDYVLEQAQWNDVTRDLLKRVRVVGIPIVNPAGFVAGTRSNGRGVDLMRNAPVESGNSIPFVGGHRISSLFPYFRGKQGWEAENVQLMGLVQRALARSPFVTTLDLHSGFGTEDFLWTPWAKKKGLPPHWPEYSRFKEVLDRTLKHHVYRYEPQSESYCTSGDIWDYLYQEFLDMRRPERVFLPLTLEVGSWIWLKKSPLNLLNPQGIFNPIAPHRERRVLRRHLPFLNLLMQAVANYEKVFLGRKLSESQTPFHTIQNVRNAS